MVDYRAIMALLFRDPSYRQVVEAVGCSHRDVSTARKVIAERGITAQRLAGMSDAELAGLFPDGRARVSAGYDSPEFARVVKSMRANPHFTLLQAWRGYVGSGSELRKYGYSQYCRKPRLATRTSATSSAVRSRQTAGEDRLLDRIDGQVHRPRTRRDDHGNAGLPDAGKTGDHDEMPSHAIFSGVIEEI